MKVSLVIEHNKFGARMRLQNDDLPSEYVNFYSHSGRFIFSAAKIEGKWVQLEVPFHDGQFHPSSK